MGRQREVPRVRDIYGTGGPIVVGSQVVVVDHGMGTVVEVGCPTFGEEAGPAFHVRIEGDREPICFRAEDVKLYADVYAEEPCPYIDFVTAGPCVGVAGHPPYHHLASGVPFAIGYTKVEAAIVTDLLTPEGRRR